MKFPNVFTIKVTDAETGAPVSNVAIDLKLFAATKNDYSIEPVITDEAGEARFTRQHCEDSIAAAQAMFISDYYSDLESCRPVLEVRVIPPHRIMGMVRQYDSAPGFWGKAFHNPEILFARLRLIRNGDYNSSSLRVAESDIDTNPEVCLELTKA